MVVDNYQKKMSTAWQTIKQFFQELQTISHVNQINDLIGIEINDEYIKLTKISQQEGRYRLDFFAVEALPKGTIVKNEIKNTSVFIALLKDICKKIGSTDGNSGICINRSAAIIKNIYVNHHLGTDEIESRVWLEANRLFPDLINDIFLDYIVLGHAKDDSEKLDVMLIACRKEQIKPYLDVLKTAEIPVHLVDVNCYALQRALVLLPLQREMLGALININFSIMTLIIYQADEQIFTYEMPIDGHHLINELHAQSKDNPPSLSIMGLPLRHMLQFFYSSRPNLKIDNMILSGDCIALAPELQRFIQLELNVTVEIANPIKDMVISEHIDKVKVEKFAPSLMLCLGLSLSQWKV